MAIYPGESYYNIEKLQPGARGETFQVSMPGYRDENDRINRTNTKLAVCAHDVPSTKWELDSRLEPLFKFGFAFGFTQVVIPKGRLVALDPNMSVVDFETEVSHNVITLANGGAPVRIRETTDTYKEVTDIVNGISHDLIAANMSGQPVAHPGKEWVPVIGMDEAYTGKCYRPFKNAGPLKQLEDAGYEIDPVNGKITKDGVVTNVRAGNTCIGIIQRNEYTRDIDAYNGMMPGPVLTDSLVTLPWFTYKSFAEKSFWGSAYGPNLYPGALVKSDENGRFTISPLSVESELADMTLAEMEMERQQVVGQVYSATHDMRPEGDSRWCHWALDDVKNYEDANPRLYRGNNRRGEDTVSVSPFSSTGQYPGYPFDKSYSEHNLHLLGSNLRDGNFDPKMDLEYSYTQLGIPGLTDGYQAIVTKHPEEVIGKIHARTNKDAGYIAQIMKLSEVNVVEGSLKVTLGNENPVDAVEGQALDTKGIFVFDYVNCLQGIVRIRVTDAEKADAYLEALGDKVADQYVEIKAEFSKRGLAGVETFMDFEGVEGSVQILLTK